MIRDLAVAGDGIGSFLDTGEVVFVKGALPGELWELSSWRRRRKILHGEGQLLTPSKERQQPFCEVFGRCGGCQIQHLQYEAGLRFKEERLKSLLERIAKDAKAASAVQALVPMQRRQGYRNTVQLKIGRGPEGIRMGFYARHSHEIVDHATCALMPALFHQVMAYLRGELEAASLALPTGLRLRYAEASQELMCVLEQNERFQDQEAWAYLAEELAAQEFMEGIGLSFWLSAKDDAKLKRLVGPKTLSEKLMGLVFAISPRSFFQTNIEGTKALYAASLAAAEKILGPQEHPRILDLYTGTGTLALLFAKAFPKAKVTGVDLLPDAIQDARRSAQEAGLSHVDFLAEDADAYLQSSQEPYDLMLVDPPRRGLSAALCSVLAESSLPYLLYISCDPGSLARDYARLKAQYELLSLQAFDLFPWTTGLESLAILKRRAG